MCTCSNGTDTCMAVGYCQFRPQTPNYDPYWHDSLPAEFCRPSWNEGGFAGTSRMSTVAVDALTRTLAATPPQRTSIGTIADFTISTSRSSGWYQPTIVIQGRVLSEQLAATPAAAYSVVPFGWLTDNSTSYAGKGTTQSLPSYVRSWLTGVNNASSMGYNYYWYKNAVPKLAGLEPPAKMSYGQLNVVVPVDGTILYLSGRVVGTLPVNASMGLLAFEGWLTAPQNSTWQPPVCVPPSQYGALSQGSASSQAVYGFITSKPIDGSGTVESTLHLQSDTYMSGPVDYWMRSGRGRAPLPEAYPGPQSIPPLNFSGLMQANYYNMGGNGKPL